MQRLLCVAGVVCAMAWTGGDAVAQVKGPAMPYPPREAEKAISPPVLGKYQPEKATNVDSVAEASQALVGKAAIAGGVAYVGDLGGVLHAIDIASGNARWTLDLGAAPETKAPGMVYGGPVVYGGRLYVATCNLEGPHAQQPTVIVCIGDK